MKKVFITLFSIVIILSVFSSFSFALGTLYSPEDLQLANQLSVSIPVNYLLTPDFAITNVVKEFISTGTNGTVYRYYVTVENLGFYYLYHSIDVRAFIGYAYPHRPGVQVQKIGYVTVPGVLSFLINESPPKDGISPSSFVIVFRVDPYDSIPELNESNNSWACDDWLGECDTCIREDCP